MDAEFVKMALREIRGAKDTLETGLSLVDLKQMPFEQKALYVMARDIQTKLKAILDKWNGD